MPRETSPTPPDLDALRLDAQALKTLAHPLRSRLLGVLRRDGEATATDLAAALSTNTGATSYHLRRLEACGLVRDTGRGTGKRRLWEASTDAHSFYPSDVADDADAETALSWLARDYSRHMSEQYERWLDAAADWPYDWQDACGSSDQLVLVNAAQLQEMSQEIAAVVARYRRVGQGNPEAKRIAVYSYVYPIDLDRTPERGHGTGG